MVRLITSGEIAREEGGPDPAAGGAGSPSLPRLRPGSLVRIVVLDHYSFEEEEDIDETLAKPIKLEYVGWLAKESPEYLVLVFGRTLEGKERRHEGICLLKSAVLEAEVLAEVVEGEGEVG